MGAGAQRWWKETEARTPEIRWARYLADTSAWTQEQTIELARVMARTYPDCETSMWAWAVAIQVIDSIQFHEENMLTDDRDVDADTLAVLSGLPVLHPMRRGAGLLPLVESGRQDSLVVTFTDDADGLMRVAREQSSNFLRRFGVVGML